MKIVFFGTSNVALPVLEALSRHHEIVAVVTSPDAKVGRSQALTESPVSVLASEMKLKLLKPNRVKNNDVLRLELASLDADIFVVVSYGYILPPEIINMPRLKTVNVHFSLLPKYRGSSPIQQTLLHGDRETGTTLFVLDERVDHGPILSQESIPVDFDDNFITLGEKLAHRSANLIIPTLAAYEAGTLLPKSQDDSAATSAPVISKQDGKVDWDETSGQIYNRFRAFYPWPGIWTEWNGKKLKITECSPDGVGVGAAAPGMVQPGGMVACGNGSVLRIRRLQLEGKTETDIQSFIHGYPAFEGTKLS